MTYFLRTWIDLEFPALVQSNREISGTLPSLSDTIQAMH